MTRKPFRGLALPGLFLGLLASTAVHAAIAEHRSIPGASPVPAAHAASLDDRSALEAFFDGIVSDQIHGHRLAGATVAVVRNGELLLLKGYGMADIEDVRPVDARASLFRIGSVSKLFTWTAVMQLVEQGRLDLDTDVNAYLDDIAIPRTFEQPITLRNLMTHTPGLEDGMLGYLVARNTGELAPLERFLPRHMPARVRAPATDFSSAWSASYSNWGAALAGLIVAARSGMPFDDYVAQNILMPLRMTRSTFAEPLPAELAAQAATGYAHKSGELKAMDFELLHNFAPAGSLSATAEDMSHFMIAQLQDGAFENARILKPETAQLMHSRQLGASPYVNGIGLGFYETWVNGRRLLSHSGDTQYFHSALHLLKEDGVGLFVSYNSGAAKPASYRDDLLRAFMDRYYPAVLPRLDPPADFAQRAQRYAGTYRLTRHSYTKNEKLIAAFSDVAVRPTRNGTLLISGLLGSPPAQWIEVAPDTFRRADRDDTIAFAAGPSGEIAHLAQPLAVIAAYKLAWYETRGFHLFAVFMACVAAIVAIVSALRNWRADRAAATGPRLARRCAALLGALNLAFVVGLAACLAALAGDPLAGFPSAIYTVLTIALVTLPLAAAVAGFAVQMWRRGWSTRYGRIQYSLVAVAGLLLPWCLNYWNLLGYRF